MSAFRYSPVVLLCLASLQAADLPSRAIAQIGSHRFYHGPRIRCTAISPDGKLVASVADMPPLRSISAEDRRGFVETIYLWDAVTGERIRELRTPLLPIYDVVFSPDGKRLAATRKLSPGGV